MKGIIQASMRSRRPHNKDCSRRNREEVVAGKSEEDEGRRRKKQMETP